MLHQGLAAHLGLRLGWVVIGVGALVLVLWIPLRQRPGIGTVANVVVVGLVVNAALPLLPHPRSLVMQLAYLVVGIVGNGVATGLYIGAGLGPGPRDGLMTALAARGHSIRVVRTGIEVSVLAVGWALGGTVGVGTLLYALSIGPVAHYFIPVFSASPRPARTPHLKEPPCPPSTSSSPAPDPVGSARPSPTGSSPAPRTTVGSTCTSSTSPR